MQLDTTLETLRSMEFSAPYLVVVNKCDLAAPSAALPQDAVLISAKNGTGLDGLKARIMEALKDGFRRVTLFIPYADSAAFAPFRSLLYEQEVRYTDDGIELRVILPTIHAQSFRHWIIK